MLDDFQNLTPLMKTEFSIDGLHRAISLHKSGIHPITRALPVASFVATAQIHGSESWGFKFHNVIIHLICGIFIFLFARRLFSTCKLANTNNITVVAFFATSLWLLHPLHVSTVLYAVQRLAQFSTLFIIVGLCCYLYGRTLSNTKLKSVYYFLLFPITLALGLMSKENGALIFVYIALTELLLRRYKPWQNLDKVFLMVFCATPLVLGVILFLAISPTLLDYSLRQFSLADRLLTQIYFVAFYLKQIVLPDLSRMGLYFDDIAVFRRFSPLILTLLALHISLLVSGLWFTFKGKILGYAIVFFYVGHLIESTVVPLEMAFEHRNYLPIVGITIGLAYAVSIIPSAILKYSVALLILTTFSLLLFTRVGFWQDEHEWQKTKLAFHPKSLRTRVSYIEYLDFNKQVDKLSDAARQAEEDFPNEPLLIMNRLGRECVLQPTQGLGDESLEKAISLIRLGGINGGRLSNISALISNHVKNTCTNLTFKKLFTLVDVAIEAENKKASSIYVGDLRAIKSMLLFRQNRLIEAKDLLVSAYETTGRINYLLDAVTAMSFKKEHTELAAELLHRIKNEPSIDLRLYAEKLSVLEKQIEELNNRP
jgi:hypothetical protein